MNVRFAIGIPTLNRYDLLKEALYQYVDADFIGVDIFIIDNGKQGIKHTLPKDFPVTVVEPDKNLGVAASWNQLCDMIFAKYEYALILNDDIYLGRETPLIEALVDDAMHRMFVSREQWCAFLISKNVFQTVGRFDESFFPAYFEDNDYAYRLNLAKIPFVPTDQLYPYVFRRSQTLEKDRSVNNNFQKNMDYFQAKWGGMPGSEKFTVPFNRYELSDDILEVDLLFSKSTLYDGKTVFDRMFDDHQLLLEKEILPDGKTIYFYEIDSGYHGDGDMTPRWVRNLETKKDVQNLVLGLTGIEI